MLTTGWANRSRQTESHGFGRKFGASCRASHVNMMLEGAVWVGPIGQADGAYRQQELTLRGSGSADRSHVKLALLTLWWGLDVGRVGNGSGCMPPRTPAAVLLASADRCTPGMRGSATALGRSKVMTLHVACFASWRQHAAAGCFRFRTSARTCLACCRCQPMLASVQAHE